MATGITLKRFQSKIIDVRWAGAFRLRIEASEPTGELYDAGVFLYNRRPANPYSDIIADTFIGIPSPVEYADYPLFEPNEESPYPFFRKSFVELDFPAIIPAEEAWFSILAQVEVLCRALDTLKNLSVTAIVRVGAALEVSDSVSTSDSDSDSL